MKRRVYRKSITQAARRIYSAAFNGETMPKGWRVYFANNCPMSSPWGGGRSRSQGVCYYFQRVVIVKRPKLQRPQLVEDPGA